MSCCSYVALNWDVYSIWDSRARRQSIASKSWKWLFSTKKICLKTGLEWPTIPIVIWILYCQAIWVSIWLRWTYSLKLRIYESINFLNTLKTNIFFTKMVQKWPYGRKFPLFKMSILRYYAMRLSKWFEWAYSFLKLRNN